MHEAKFYSWRVSSAHLPLCLHHLLIISNAHSVALFKSAKKVPIHFLTFGALPKYISDVRWTFPIMGAEKDHRYNGYSLTIVVTTSSLEKLLTCSPRPFTKNHTTDSNLKKMLDKLEGMKFTLSKTSSLIALEKYFAIHEENWFVGPQLREKVGTPIQTEGFVETGPNLAITWFAGSLSNCSKPKMVSFTSKAGYLLG